MHGMYGDGVKKHTKVIKRSREPHWNKEFTFLIRGEPHLSRKGICSNCSMRRGMVWF